MAEEFELKFSAPNSGVLDEILRDARLRAMQEGEEEKIRMRTRYYDTPDGALSARRWTLRARQENEKSVVTLKTPGEGYARGEWECEGIDPVAAAGTLIARGAPQELAALLKGGAEEVCGAAFCRRLLRLRLEDGTRLEVCADEGKLFGGARQAPLCELELEWKGGEKETFLAFSRALSARFSLPEEGKSKFIRARQLANGE